MKRLALIILGVAALTLAGCSTLPLKDPDSITYPRSRFELPKAERIVLKNGMILYLIEDHELPLVTMSAVIGTGSMYDPPGKEGLSDLTGTVMRTGGTEHMSSDGLDDALDFMAASISVSMERESGTFTLSVLSEDLELGAGIFSDMLMHPVFETAKLEQEKNLKIESLRRIYDNPQRLAFREFTRLIYAGNPREKLSSAESVGNIDRSDLVEFHRQFFYPGNVMIALSGDITRREALDILNRCFGTWNATGTVQSMPSVEKKREQSINYIFKDIPQSVIILGQVAPGKRDSDFFSFQVLDFILGSGGFNARIFHEVRNNLGLAYSAGSFYSAHTDFGIFAAYAMTKSSSTAQALSVMHSIINDIQGVAVKKKELDWAKKSIDSSFVFSFASSHQIAIQQLMLEYNDLPDDFLSTYRRNIDDVSMEDVNKAARTYLSLDSETMLILGNDTKFDEPLSRFGKVRKIEVHNGR